MNRRTILVVGILLIVSLILCRALRKPPEPWVPVLESTGFQYLGASVSRALEGVRTARQAAASSHAEKAEEALAPALDALVKLDRYYLPLTEVRELVYDADRLFYLGDLGAAVGKLERSKELLRGVGSLHESSLRKTTNEVVLEIDELLLAMGDAPGQVGALFEEVGHRVNLMVLKGELILANVHVDAEGTP